MILVYHQNFCIQQVISVPDQKIKFDSSGSVASVLYKLAQQFPDEKIVWCHVSAKEHLNISQLDTLFHHNKMMLSYNPADNYFGLQMGYIEDSPFVNVNKKVLYPTWQMSSVVGVVHAAVLNAVKHSILAYEDFDYFLNSVAKTSMPRGLLCYSQPMLLCSGFNVVPNVASTWTIFKFVKKHYRTRWTFLLFFNLLVYERKLMVFPLLYSLFFKNNKTSGISLDAIEVRSSSKVVKKGTIDVVIPTIGRKEYLYDVLKDLSKQTHLPQNVIIVEQNPEPSSTTSLDYLNNETWPFAIDHTFTHQAGACNARNIALSKVKSEWVFLNDDDNRFEPHLIEETLRNIKKYGCLVASNSYPKIGEETKNNQVSQAAIFGSGNSFLNSKLLTKVSFNMGLEFGYGEDSDFGLQLRNLGNDVIYFPEPRILHLNAPMGGFRTKPILAWQQDSIVPKPSPTIMLFKLLHSSREQLSGYKTILFFKYYKHQKLKNPISYHNMFQKQWQQSLFWANQLMYKS